VSQALVVSMTSIVLHPALADLQLGNPGLFEKLMRRIQHRPQYGSITLNFVDGKLAHIRTEVSDR
jgi:hypothetical protein